MGKKHKEGPTKNRGRRRIAQWRASQRPRYTTGGSRQEQAMATLAGNYSLFLHPRLPIESHISIPHSSCRRYYVPEPPGTAPPRPSTANFSQVHTCLALPASEGKNCDAHLPGARHLNGGDAPKSGVDARPIGHRLQGSGARRDTPTPARSQFVLVYGLIPPFAFLLNHTCSFTRFLISFSYTPTRECTSKKAGGGKRERESMRVCGRWKRGWWARGRRLDINATSPPSLNLPRSSSPRS